MPPYRSKHLITTLLLIGMLIATAGCINPSPITIPQNATTPPSPQPTPNPLGLDTDGYYIADFGYKHINKDDFVVPPYTNFTEITPLIKKYRPTIQTPVIFNVSLEQWSITSGEFVTFTGTTNLPPNSTIGIDISITHVGLHQLFSAPVLPGINGTNLIKVKIPAMDIHIDNYFESTDHQFLSNGTYSPMISFGPYFTSTWITSDPPHPMIIEQNPCQSIRHMRSCNTTNIWWWTNDTATPHIWDAQDPLYENGTITPYPTYPRPPKTCLKQAADTSGNVLVIC